MQEIHYFIIQDLQWGLIHGENPKKPGLDEYEGITSIVLAIVFAAVGSFIVSIAAFCNIRFCGMGSNDGQNSSIFGATTEAIEDYEPYEEPTEDIEDTESTGETESDSYDDSGEGVPSDSGEFPLEIGDVTVQLSFDTGATVYATDYNISVSRKYDDDTSFEIEYADSYSEIGDTEYLYVSDYYDGIDGYTLVESKEKELLDDGSSYVSYNIYKDEDGKYYINATIWQDIGAGNYLEIKVETDAADNIEDVIDGSIISL